MDNTIRVYPPQNYESSFQYVDVEKGQQVRWLYCRNGDKKIIYGYAILKKKPRKVKRV